MRIIGIRASLVGALFLLTGCDEDDKVLNELKEMNHRQDHQGKIQSYYHELYCDLKTINSATEKQNILNSKEEERRIHIEETKKWMLENLYKLKALCEKDFIGKFSTEVRAFAIEESSSIWSFLFRKILLIITSNENDSDMRQFKDCGNNISDCQIIIRQHEDFPYYVDLKSQKSIEDRKFSICDSRKSLNESISIKIKSIEDSFIRRNKKYR